MPTTWSWASSTRATPRRFLGRDARTLAEVHSLSLHPEKTRLIEFGRRAATNRKQRGLGKPETFAFLGFTFICGKSRRGRFLLRRKSRGDRMRAKQPGKEIKAELRRRMHQPIPFTSRGEVVEASSSLVSSHITRCRPTVAALCAFYAIAHPAITTNETIRILFACPKVARSRGVGHGRLFPGVQRTAR